MKVQFVACTNIIIYATVIVCVRADPTAVKPPPPFNTEYQIEAFTITISIFIVIC